MAAAQGPVRRARTPARLPERLGAPAQRSSHWRSSHPPGTTLVRGPSTETRIAERELHGCPGAPESGRRRPARSRSQSSCAGTARTRRLPSGLRGVHGRTPARTRAPPGRDHSEGPMKARGRRVLHPCGASGPLPMTHGSTVTHPLGPYGGGGQQEEKLQRRKRRRALPVGGAPSQGQNPWRAAPAPRWAGLARKVQRRGDASTSQPRATAALGGQSHNCLKG